MEHLCLEGASLPSSCPDAKKRRVCYFYDPSIGNYYYGTNHPMKPHRIRMSHRLIIDYDLLRHMESSLPLTTSDADLCCFHSDDYVKFLSSVSPESLGGRFRELKRFNVGGADCPVFYDLFHYCRASAGGSLGAAAKLNNGDADIAIHWAGGHHHAKKSYASGICYVNDIVLGILELLKVHNRVLYVDIDVHHGDGVEEAFYTSDRVMTVSFHQFGNFFPGTGHVEDIGAEDGRYYALNVPLKEGMDDDSFHGIFQPIIQKVMEVYKPDVVVLQCGADSLAGDRLGNFNLSTRGHAGCLRFLRSFNVPLMVLGGGGYTIQNVSRCWCYETAVAVGVEPDNKLPENEYYGYFAPDYNLHVESVAMKNLNSRNELKIMRNMLLEQISRLPHAPSVPFQTPPLAIQFPEEEEEDMDTKPKQPIWDSVDYDEPFSRLPHAPSIPYQSPPPNIQFPEEAEEDEDRKPKKLIWNVVDLNVPYTDEEEKLHSQSLNCNGHSIANTKDMDRRPKMRIWNGMDYDKYEVDEKDKPRRQGLNSNDDFITNAEITDIADGGDEEEDKAESHPKVNLTLFI